MTLAAEVLGNEPHHSVLSREAIQALVTNGGTYLDLTVGYGGHAQAILEAHPAARLIACDRDAEAVQAATRRLLPFGERVEVVHTIYTRVDEFLRDRGIERVDGLIADLGVSSVQLDSPERGMSFRREGPLDMRMDPTAGETALELVERMTADELADVIFYYGEERRSRRIARCIKQALESGQLRTTWDLRRAVVRAVGPRRVGGIDPATRTFQGLRIAVNDELENLTRMLELAPKLLRAGGVAVFLSFHSLEDRLVKRAFQQRELWEPLSKKPIVAGDEEREHNPRSRSAKMRAACRLACAHDGTEP